MARHNELETTSPAGNWLVVSLQRCCWYCRWRQFPASLALRSRLCIPALKITSSPTSARGCNGIRTCLPNSRKGPCRANRASTSFPRRLQQRLLNRLRQINRMPPEQRQRTLDHIEAMEHLTPQMRQQVRASFQDFRSLPPDRQRMVRKAFRDLREYPPEQREAMMNSRQVSGSVHAPGAQHPGQHPGGRALPCGTRA